MALSEVALASLILVVWMYFQQKVGLAKEIIEHTVEGIMVTDTSGKIISVNPAFKRITGYQEEEVIGKKPNILKSGKQSKEFYEIFGNLLKRLNFGKVRYGIAGRMERFILNG